MKRLLAVLGLFSMLSACESGTSDNNDTTPLPSPTTIRASVTLNDIPTDITIDDADSDSQTLEYEWSVTFDVNDDGVINEGDVKIGIIEVKHEEDIERIVSTSELVAHLWQYSEPDVMSEKGVIDFVINDNTITFICDRGLLAELTLITNLTQVYVKAYKNTPAITSMDYLPAYDTYTQVQYNSFVIDEQQDYILLQTDANSTPVDIYDFRLQIAE